MAISKYTADREKQKFKESSSVSGQPGVVVLNPDGSSLSGGTGASAGQSQGTAADNAAATGNPVQVGGVYNSSPQTYANGDVAARQVDVNGNEKVTSGTLTGAAVPSGAYYVGMLTSGGNLIGLTSAAGLGIDATNGTNLLSSAAWLFNGTNYDRTRGNTTGVVVAAATATTQTAIAVPTYNASKLMIVVNTTGGAGTVTVAINSLTSSSYSVNLLTSTALTGTSTTALRIFPGATVAANLSANDLVPKNVSITATVSGSITYGIDYVLSV